MEFFEFVFLFSVAFVLPLTIIKMSLDYKKAKVQAEAGSGNAEGAGVTAGELKRLLRDAVEEANAPLLQRIDAVEMAVLGDQSEHVRAEGLLDEADAEFDEVHGDAQERTLGRRVAE